MGAGPEVVEEKNISLAAEPNRDYSRARPVV
jgi:hypothetical protein